MIQNKPSSANPMHDFVPQPSLDVGAIQAEIEAGYINEQPHPSAPLRILNYSQRAQFDWRWNAETMQCRGLIVDHQWNIVSRPFPKFFSVEQLNGIVPVEPFEAYEKMDGSLGILYFVDGKPQIASRGSFTSEQAIWATEWLLNNINPDVFDRSCTYLFEIVARWNRIVVDYDFDGLVLLAIIETKSGKEKKLPSIQEVQAWSRNDTGKHLHATEQGVEVLQGLPDVSSEKRQGEAPCITHCKREEVESRKQATVKGAGEAKLQQDSRVFGLSEVCPVCRLRRDVSPLRYGLRSHNRKETTECREMSEPEEDERGNRKVRGCVCQLPPDSHIPFGSLKVVKRYDGFSQFEELMATQDGSREGFVVRFESGQRIKIKFEEYKRLHKLLTGVSPKAIWEVLRSGRDLSKVIERVPDEFFQWVRETENDLRAAFASIEATARGQMTFGGSRKEIAERFKKCQHPSVMFAMLDGKDYAEQIWRMIRPSGKAFRCDVDV